jgi:hypothetical protein
MTPPPADLLPDFLHAIEPIAARPGPYGTTVSITPNEARALVEILRRPHPIAGDGWNEAIGRAAETAYCCTSVDDAVTAIRALRRPAPQPPAGETRERTMTVRIPSPPTTPSRTYTICFTPPCNRRPPRGMRRWWRRWQRLYGPA